MVNIRLRGGRDGRSGDGGGRLGGRGHDAEAVVTDKDHGDSVAVLEDGDPEVETVGRLGDRGGDMVQLDHE